MNHELLIEHLNPQESNLAESVQNNEEGGKTCYLSGIFMQSGVKNHNQRVYPLDELSRAVESAQDKIKEYNGIFGELDHPQTLTINLDRVSHVITELKMVEGNAVGKAKIINTPMGEIARALVESGVRFGISSRGTGQLDESGFVSGFDFITADVVATPSAPGALPETMYESIMNDKHGYKAYTLAEQVKEDPKAQKYFQDEITKFIRECLNRK